MQRFIGLVVGTAMQKTIKVCVERLVKHKRFPRILRLKKNYLVDDPKEVAIVGDLVSIKYGGKMSVRKYFELTEILKEARKYRHPVTGKIFTAPAARQPAENWQKVLHQ